MKATELRIGNFVWDDYSGEMIVSGIAKQNGLQEELRLKKHNGLPEGSYICETIQPIPITEEWLLKFGFKVGLNERDDEDDRIILHVYRNKISIAEKNKTFYFYITIEDDTYYNFKWVELKYVHQLQNLYFALTGEELTLK